MDSGERTRKRVNDLPQLTQKIQLDERNRSDMMEALALDIVVYPTREDDHSPAKTVADCFKFRNRVSLNVALEALGNALRRKLVTRGEPRYFAAINRVSNVMRPYMEMEAAL